MKLHNLNLTKFIATRKRLFNLIDEELKIDSHHKSYEGTLRIVFNNRFAYDEDNPEIHIELSCYVAPLNGRGDTFDSLESLNTFLDYWEEEIERYKCRELEKQPLVNEVS